MTKKVTMKDLAKFLNLDRTTISKALTASPGVSPDTIEKVQQAAELFGYRKDSLASGLYTGKNAMVGLILAEIRRGIYAPLVESFQRAVMKHNFGVIIYYFNRDIDNLAHAIDVLKQQRISGATFISPRASVSLDQYLTEFAESGIAVNTMERSFMHQNIDCVQFDHRKAGYELTNYLLKLGHRRIAFMTFAGIKGTPEGRLEGYMEAMRDAGLQEMVIAEDTPVSHLSGDEMMLAYERLQKIWDRIERPSAFIGVNDNFALGILHFLKEKGVNVPGEISIAGFDDLTATLGIPQMTTMRSPMQESGERLGELLIERMNTHVRSATVVKLPYEMIVRQSTAAHKQ